MKTLLKLFVFASVIILIAISCQKILSNGDNVNPSKEFTTAFVRSWYNKTFIKSPEFATFNQKENGKKQPDWENGKYRKVGNMEILEFPLLKEKKTISVKSDKSLTDADKKRIASASLKRISFIRTANNEIVVRELDYVPEWEYLKTKNYDISDVELGKAGNKFTGRIVTKKWSGEVLSVRLLNEGKIKGRLIKKQKSSETGINVMECETYEYCDETEWCEMEWNGDAYVFVVPNNCYWVEECRTEQECVWVEPVCNYELSESCECQLYGIGCSEGEGGEDPPPPPPDPCTVAQPAADATKTLSQTSTYIGAKSDIQGANSNVEHSVTFGTDANGNTTASSMTSCTSPSTCTVNTSWPGAFADLHNHSNDLPPSPGDMYNLIGVNNNHSGYNTRMVVTPDGSVFALVVLDLAAADTFKSKYPSVDIGYGPDFPSEIYVKFDEVKDQFMLQGLSSIIAEERAMSYVLDKYNTGIALLKQDSNGNFKRLKTDENTSNGNTTYTANNCQ